MTSSTDGGGVRVKVPQFKNGAGTSSRVTIGPASTPSTSSRRFIPYGGASSGFPTTPEISKHTPAMTDRKSTRLNSSHGYISYAVFCLKKKKKTHDRHVP